MYPLTALCWANKNANLKPNKFPQLMEQDIFYSYWKQIYCLELWFLRLNRYLYVQLQQY